MSSENEDSKMKIVMCCTLCGYPAKCGEEKGGCPFCAEGVFVPTINEDVQWGSKLSG